jgi:hypothetical protein
VNPIVWLDLIPAGLLALILLAQIQEVREPWRSILIWALVVGAFALGLYLGARGAA